MKTTSLVALIAAAALPQFASAQTSSTPVIGYYKIDVPAGNSAWVCGFVTKKDFQGQATSVAAGAALADGSTTTVITQTGAAFGAFPLHYVDVIAPAANEGMVMDIVSSTATTLRVKGTIAGTPTYAVRRHATVGSIFKGGAGLAVGSDTVSLYDDNGNVATSIYNGSNWEDSLTGDPTTDMIVYPGQGFVINNGSSPRVSRSVTIGGDEVSYVKTTKTQTPLYVGTTNLVGLVNPLVATAAADPIFNTSGVSTLGAFNFSGPALTDGSDFIDQLSLDGLLSGVGNYIDNGSNIEDSLTGDDATTKPVRNGTALSVKVFGLDKSSTQSVTHPIN